MIGRSCKHPYPIDSFPARLRVLILEIHQRTGVALEIIATEVLAAIAAVVQAHAIIKIPGLPPTPLGLFVQIIVSSGGGKGVIAEIVNREIRNSDARWHVDFETRRSEFRAKKCEWADRLQVLREERRRAFRNRVDCTALTDQIRRLDDVRPREPNSQSLVRSDISISRLIVELAAPTASLYLTQNEGSEFYRSSAAEHLGTLCSAYSGEESLIDRTNKWINAKRPRLSINCRIQPKVFDKEVKRKLEILVQSGFFNRTLFVRSDVNNGIIQPLLEDYETPARADFDRCVSEHLAPLTVTPDGEPKELRFAPDALAEFHNLRQVIARDVVDGMPLSEINGAALRLLENIARIAGGAAFFLGERGPISLESFRFAKAVALWHLSEFERLFSPASAPQEQLGAEKLEKFLRERLSYQGFFDAGWRIGKRRLTTCGPIRKRDGGTAALDAALHLLAGQGKIAIAPGPINQPELGAWIQLKEPFFNVPTSAHVPFLNPAPYDERIYFRNYSQPCRCLRCRY